MKTGNHIWARARIKELLDEVEQKMSEKTMTHKRMDQIESETRECEEIIATHKTAQSWFVGPTDQTGWSSSGDTQGIMPPMDVRAKNRAPSLSFDPDAVRLMHEALKAGASYSVRGKGFTGDIGMKAGPYSGVGVNAALPAQLHPQILGLQHENRLLERLPTLATEAPSYQFVRALGNTGAPAVTGEGQIKPTVSINVETVIAAPVKIAMTTSVSWETLQDYDRFVQYLVSEIPQAIIEVENSQLLYGSGNSEILGLANTPGIIKHAVGGDTALDAVEIGIEQLRSGSALATPDLFVTSPSSWSALRRSKNLQNEYLVAPNPTAAEATSLWGLPVLVTTSVQPGHAFLVDTTKAGFILVREGLNLRQGTSDDDFVRNLVRWVAEERLASAWEIPKAILQLTGLPTTAAAGS